MAEFKTNVMRFLDQKKIKYIPHEYPVGEDIPTDAVTVSSLIEKDPSQVYKTLVTVGASKKNYVFVIPAAAQLDFKKCAKAAGEKNIEMIKQKELLPLTGYIHGGCSPIGMKKQFTTVIDESAILFDTIIFSAGKIGYQVEVSVNDINKIVDVSFVEVTD